MSNTPPQAAPEAPKISNFLRQIIEKDLEQGTYASRRWAGSPGDAAHHAQGEPDPAKAYRVPTDLRPQVGPDDALVTIVEFSDFQCPFCSRVEPTIQALRRRYGNDLRVVWRNGPLPFHDHAQLAAEAAMEAYAQRGHDGFWHFHDALFADRGVDLSALHAEAARLRARPG